MQELNYRLCKHQLKKIFNINLNDCRYFNGCKYIKLKHNNILYVYSKKTKHINKIIDLTIHNYK